MALKLGLSWEDTVRIHRRVCEDKSSSDLCPTETTFAMLSRIARRVQREPYITEVQPNFGYITNKITANC
jgi:hypothetical protein